MPDYADPIDRDICTYVGRPQLIGFEKLLSGKQR